MEGDPECTTREEPIKLFVARPLVPIESTEQMLQIVAFQPRTLTGGAVFLEALAFMIYVAHLPPHPPPHC